MFFYMKIIYKKMRVVMAKSEENLRKSQSSSSKVHLFYLLEIDISSFFAVSFT